MSVATASPEPTLSCRAAAIKLGVTNHAVTRLAAMGRIKVHVEMGSPIRYARADVDRILAERNTAQAAS